MKIKPGVVLPDKLEMRQVLINAEQIWKAQGVELWVTSGMEGEHSAGSLHPYGYALDLRSSYFSEETAKEVAKELKDSLCKGYDVVAEKTHIHAEFDQILRKNAT
jgi:hypothetical protein